MGAGKSVICSDLIKGNSYSLECAKSAKRKIILDEVKKKSRAYCYLTKGLSRRGHFFNVLIDKNITEIARSAMEENAKWRDFIELVMSQGFSNEAPCFEKVRRAKGLYGMLPILRFLMRRQARGESSYMTSLLRSAALGLALASRHHLSSLRRTLKALRYRMSLCTWIVRMKSLWRPELGTGTGVIWRVTLERSKKRVR